MDDKRRLCDIISGFCDDLRERVKRIDDLEQLLHRTEHVVSLKREKIEKLKQDCKDLDLKLENEPHIQPVQEESSQGKATSPDDDLYTSGMEHADSDGYGSERAGTPTSWNEEVVNEMSENPHVIAEPEGIRLRGSKRRGEDNEQGGQKTKRAQK
ncbi:hypothetical protein CYLTODRAFT_426857 [Cylindrobasidium torrendii FP15055 ss-10]|uniref:Uncharacterized protein n=1 Tax=Cylindrobasidium torrendii FP15055 ss-10 TaxID=1314674 RepID=A0A0D7AXD3_9AGAR|nr:hypothetical protein CYLTODRAFT_426857 [Cylindrobasidium torrendii FP15055 ss-10]